MSKIGELKVLLEADIKGLKKGLAQAEKHLKDVEKSTGKVSKSIDKGLSPATTRLGGIMNKTTASIVAGFAGGMGVTWAIGAASRAVGDMIQTGREFERSWANVTTMLDTSAEETDRLKRELMNLSPTLGDTTDLAEGMYQVLSASIEPAKAIDVLTASAKAAQAGLTDTATAVDAITTVINAYGLEAEQATEVSDIMFKTVKSGKLTYEELAHSLGTVVPVASQVGVGFDEISAATATLTRQGIDAQTATMQLRQVLMAILKPSEQAKQKAEELGLAFDAQALKSKGLVGFLKDLKDKTHGDSEAMAALVPNVRALTGVMALAGEQADDFANDLIKMQDAAGATEEAFNKQKESIDFWIRTAQRATDQFKIAFYEGFVEPLKQGIQSAEELTERTENLKDTFNELGKLVGTALYGWFEQLNKKIQDTKKWTFVLDVASRGLVETIKNGQIPTIKNATRAYGDWQREQKGTASLLDGSKAIVNVLTDAYKKYTGQVDDNTEATEENAKSVKTLSTETKDLGKETKEAYDDLKDLTGLNITGWANEGAVAIETITEQVAQLGQSVIDANELWEQNAPDMQEWANDNAIPALDNVTEATEEAVGNMTSLWEQMADGLKTKWATTFSEMLSGATSFKDGLDQLWDGMKQVFFDIIGQMIAEFLTNFVGSVLSGAATAGTAVGTLSGGVASLTGAITGLVTGIASALPAIATAIATAAQILASALPQILAVGAAAIALYAGFMAVNELLDSGGGGDSSYTNKLLETIAWDQSAKMDHTNQQLNEIKLTAWKIKDKIGALYNAMTTQGTVYVNMFASEPIEQLGQGINSGFTGLERGMKDMGGRIGSGIGKGIKSLTGLIPEAQSGFHGTVSKPTLMTVHPSEYINITPFSQVKSPQESTLNQNMVIQIEPVVIPRDDGYVIEFFQKSIKRGNIRIPPESIG